MSLAISIGSDSISIYRNGEFFQVDSSHPNYNPLRAELARQPRDEEAIMALAELPKYMTHVTSGRVEITENAVLFKGYNVSGYMVDRLISRVQAGEETESWAKFMDNLMDNPQSGVREDLYKWMEVGKMPITEDGCIIAFKKVREDYTDVHTGKFDNRPGSALEMDRDLCDPSRNNTCSTGFHFCSVGYLSSFSGSRVVVVKVNPRDVTAIPSDYNNQKARCCKYVVLSELKSEAAARHKVWSNNVLSDKELVDPREMPDVLTHPKGKKPSEIEADADRVNGPHPALDSDGVVPATPRVPGGALGPQGITGKAKAKSTKKSSGAKKTGRKKATVKSQNESAGAAAAADVFFQKPKRAAKKTTPKSAPALPADGAQAKPFTSKGATFTAEEIMERYAACGSNLTETAKQMGVARTTMHGWVHKLGLSAKP